MTEPKYLQTYKALLNTYYSEQANNEKTKE